MKKVRGEARRDTFQHHPFLFSEIVPVYQMSFRMQCKPNFPLVSEMRFTMMLVQLHISLEYCLLANIAQGTMQLITLHLNDSHRSCI